MQEITKAGISGKAAKNSYAPLRMSRKSTKGLAMTSRERLRAVLDHKPVDRLCVDLGAGGQTGMGVCAVHRLREAILGKSDHKVKVSEPYQMLGEIDEELRKALRLDVVGVHPPYNMFGFRDEGWKPFTMPVDGTEMLVPEKFNYTVDKDGRIPIRLDPQATPIVASEAGREHKPVLTGCSHNVPAPPELLIQVGGEPVPPWAVGERRPMIAYKNRFVADYNGYRGRPPLRKRGLNLLSTRHCRGSFRRPRAQSEPSARRSRPYHRRTHRDARGPTAAYG